MKHVIPMLALAIGVATVAEAATAPAPKSAPSHATTAAPKTTGTAAASTKAQPASKAKPAHQPESQMHLGLRAIGGSLGFVSPENSDGTVTLGLFADCGRITPRIMLEPHLDYWSKTQESFGARATARDFILGARGKYLFETSNPRLQPFAGAGLSLHFAHAEVSVSVPPGNPPMTAEASATRLGLDIGGGISTPIGARSDLLGELWYGMVTDASQFSMRVGMSYRLNR